MAEITQEDFDAVSSGLTPAERIKIGLLFEIRDTFKYLRRNLPRLIKTGGKEKALKRSKAYEPKQNRGWSNKLSSKPGHKQRS